MVYVVIMLLMNFYITILQKMYNFIQREEADLRIILLTNFCPFYRIGIFKLMQEKLQTKIVLFAIGKEKFWEEKNPIYADRDYHVLNSRNFLESCINLLRFLKKKQPDIIIKSIDGKVEVLTAFLYAKITRRPFILWTEVWYLPRGLKGGIRRLGLSIIYRYSNIIVVSGENVSWHLKSFKINPKKILIAPNATDNEFYCKPIGKKSTLKLKKRLFNNDNLIVLFVGRLEKHKGADDLIKIMPVNPHLNFLIIGNGSLNKEVKIVADNFSNIRFIGYKTREDLVKYYSLCDTLILPSKTEKTFREPWGFVINEAMLQKKAIIASDAVGSAIAGLVKHSINGYIFKEGNVEQLDQILKKIEKKRLKVMGQESWKIIQAWNYETMFNGFKQAVDFVNQTR